MNSVLQEAMGTVVERGESYGSPKPHWDAVASAWRLYIEEAGGVEALGSDLCGYHACNMMNILKAFRGAKGYKRDNQVDQCGYAWCAEQCASPLNEAMEAGA